MSTPNTPLISVIIPIYNAAPYLNEALDSVRCQTYSNLEIICLNDGSTDTSLEIMRCHASHDERIRVIDKLNEGYGATCNRGLSEAHGEYIAILEPDDWIEEGMYADLIEHASAYVDEDGAGWPDIIKSPYWRIINADTPQMRKVNCSYKARIHPSTTPFVITDPGAVHLLCHHPSIWTALYKRSFLEQFHITFRTYPGAGWADNPFLIETLMQASSIVYLDTPYYCYREETPEKAAQFAQRSPLLPMERWQDMADTLDKLHVVDEGVWRAHNSRGFTYLSGVVEIVGLEDEGLKEAARRVFKRMDAELVFSDPHISPHMKELFAQMRGCPLPRISKIAYWESLIAEGLYRVKNQGIGFTLAATFDFFKRIKKREAR